MRVAYYHAGTVGNAEVVAAIVAAGHVVMQRSAEFFRDAEKSVEAVVVDDGVKLEEFIKAYSGKQVVTAEGFAKFGFGGEEKQTPAKPEPEPEKPFNPDEPSKVRGKRKQG